MVFVDFFQYLQNLSFLLHKKISKLNLITMNNQMNQNFLTAEQISAEQARFITKVYAWMAFALSITAFTAMYVASNENLVLTFVGNRLVFYACLFAYRSGREVVG